MTTARHTPTPRRSLPRPRGFSLVELLVVIAIIGILITLLFAAGGALVATQRRNITQGVLSSLDRALEEFLASNRSAIPIYDPDQYADTPGPHYRGTDGAMREGAIQGAAYHEFNGESHVRWPDAAVFIRQASPFGEVSSVIAQIPDRFQVLTLGDENTAPADDPDRFPSILDAWESSNWRSPWPLAEQQLIYYVHPDNDLAQSLYGRCQNRRPYFFSAGPDQLYGSTIEFTTSAGAPTTDPQFAEQAVAGLEDNLYSYDVNPLENANLTQGFNTSVR